jgi:anti-anti-sigma factor
MPAFRCDVVPDHQVVRVRPVGELDMSTCPEAEAALIEARTGGCAHVVLDLRATTFFDSTALRLVLSWMRRAQADGFCFEVGRPSPAAMRVFEISELLERVPFEGEQRRAATG